MRRAWRIASAAVLAAVVAAGGLRLWSAHQEDEHHRSVAIGMMLDQHLDERSLERGVEIAELVRRRYGIDTGRPVEDRIAAARRVNEEVLAPLTFADDELKRTARELGFDPDDCADYCSSLVRLARIELKKRALVAFATAAPSDG